MYYVPDEDVEDEIIQALMAQFGMIFFSRVIATSFLYPRCSVPQMCYSTLAAMAADNQGNAVYKVGLLNCNVINLSSRKSTHSLWW